MPGIVIDDAVREEPIGQIYGPDVRAMLEGKTVFYAEDPGDPAIPTAYKALNGLKQQVRRRPGMQLKRKKTTQDGVSGLAFWMIQRP